MKRVGTAAGIAFVVLSLFASCSLIVDVGELAERDSSTEVELDVPQEADQLDEADSIPDDVVHPDEMIEASDETEDDGTTCSWGRRVGSSGEGTWHVADMVIPLYHSGWIMACDASTGTLELILDAPGAPVTCSQCDGTGTSGPECYYASYPADVLVHLSVRCIGGPCSWSVYVGLVCFDA